MIVRVLRSRGIQWAGLITLTEPKIRSNSRAIRFTFRRRASWRTGAHDKVSRLCPTGDSDSEARE